MTIRIALASVAAAAFAAYGTAATAAGPVTACSGHELTGAFTAVPGSAGAGSITYRLRLVNTSRSACWVSGIPRLLLLGAQGRALPTHVSPARPGTATAARIVLRPGRAATADARFSPDVPGPGEQTRGQCEPTAHRLRVTLSRGTVTVPVTPPTPVCEHGALRLSLFSG